MLALLLTSFDARSAVANLAPATTPSYLTMLDSRLVLTNAPIRTNGMSIDFTSNSVPFLRFTPGSYTTILHPSSHTIYFDQSGGQTVFQGPNDYFTIGDIGAIGLSCFATAGADPFSGRRLDLIMLKAATASVQQRSPALNWDAQGWSTNLAHTELVGFSSYAEAFSGGATPSGQWVLKSICQPGTAVTNLVISSSSGYTGLGTKVLYDNGYFDDPPAGATFNPTSGFSPYNNAGAWADSWWYYTANGMATDTNIYAAGTLYGNDLSITNGGSFGAPVLTTSPSTNGPAGNEFITADWARRTFAGNGAFFYNSTNQAASAFDPGNTYQYIGSYPSSGGRSYTPAAGDYFGSVITTNRFQQVNGPVLVQAYLTSVGGPANSVYRVHPEIYYTYDTNSATLLGDFEAADQSIIHGPVTNRYDFAVSFPPIISTNNAGFWLVRRFKVGSKVGTDTLTLSLGTNGVSLATSTPSSISFTQPATAGANWVASGTTDSTLVGQARYGSGIVTNNLGAVLSVGDTTFMDISKASQTNQVSGALTFAHATNGVDGVDLTHVAWLFNSSGSDQALTFPIINTGVNGWRTNVYSPVPTAATNNTITKIILNCGGTTDTAAKQTNCYVSFEYFK